MFEKKSGVVIAVGLVSVLSVSEAQANDGFYVGAQGGVNFLNRQQYDVDGTNLASARFEPGWLAGLNAGYAFSNGLRAELEADHRNDYFHSASVAGTTVLSAVLGPALGSVLGLGPNQQNTSDVRGQERAESAFANLWFDFGKSGPFHPYIGGGIGASKVSFSNAGYNNVNFHNDHDVVMSYQGGAGFVSDLTDNLSLSLDYRRVSSLKGKYDLVGDGSQVKLRYRSDSIIVGLRYSFGHKPAPVPEPTPEPAAVVPVDDAPAAPPVVVSPPSCESPEAGQPITLDGCTTGDLVVLRGVNFEFDKARLTPNAETILDGVATALTKRSEISVELDGHTDNKGSDAYNLKLSDRRARSVKQYLTGHGISGSRMTTKGFGATRPIADNDTEEGRELNRRVELEVLSSSSESAPAAAEATVAAPAVNESSEAPADTDAASPAQ